MKIFNIKEIFDNGEFITILTESGSSIHLPADSQHSIVIHMRNVIDIYSISITVDLYQG